MVPPLAAWLAGYLAWGWWSGRTPGPASRVIGLVLIAACAAIAVLYLRGYHRPPHHPLPPSAGAVATSMLLYLSLAIYPRLSSYWWPASLIATLLVVATLGLLAIASTRSPGERPRALGLMAILLSMLVVAGAIGFSRAGLGAVAILASRYVTLTIPLFCVLYIAWLVYARGRARLAMHAMLLALIGLTLPDTYRTSRAYGWRVRVAEQRLERGLINHLPEAELVSRACPALYPDPATARGFFRMLKAARMGAFARYEDGGIASTAGTTGPLRR
jgi:hypothetical protein